MKNLLFSLLFSFFFLSLQADEITVKTGANLHDALKTAREWRRLAGQGHAEYQEKIRGGITIKIGSGVHRLYKPLFLRPEDRGTAESPTRFVGEAGAVISGGVPITGWKKVEIPSAKPKGTVAYAAPMPKVNGRLVETRQLWVNGKKAQRAQLFLDGVLQKMTDFRKDERTIIIPTPSIDLSQAEGLEMLVSQRWAIAILRVKALRDLGNGQTAVSFHDPESELEFAHPWPQPVIEGDNRSAFTLMNAMELLDQPNEWFQKGDSIYYLSPNGKTPIDAVIPYLTTLINIEGTEQRPITHVSFENISFQHAAWLRPSFEGHVTLQGGFRMLDAYKLPIAGLPEKATLENQAWIARPETAIRVVNADNLTFKNCRFAHLAATGLDLEDNVSLSSVNDCRFSDIGGTALQIGTFPDRGFETHIPYIPEKPELLCRNITVCNNEIYDATNEDWGCVGIAAGYVSNILIENNHVHHLNYSGICVGWGWTKLDSSMKNNIIRRNEVHDFALQLYDAGGIYTLSNQPGSQIVENKIYNIGKAPYATNNRAFYIYFDEATDGYTVERNWYPSSPTPNPDPFGYNQPGSAMKVENNGPTVKL